LKNKNILKKHLRILPDNLEIIKKELEDLAASGWMLDRKDGNVFIFRKAEKKIINFAVEIFDKASDFDTFPNKYNMEYIEYCEKAGWHYICSSGKIQFFVSEDLNLIPIETDDGMKFDVICKMSRRTILMTSVLLPIIGFINLLMNFTFYWNSIDLSFTNFSIVVLWIGIILAGIINTIRWFVWKKKCKRSVDIGAGIIYRKYLTLKSRFILLGFILGIWSICGIIAWNRFGQLEDAGIFVICIIVLTIVLLINGLSKIVQKRKLDSSANAIFQIVIIPCVVYFFIGIWCVVILFGMNRNTHNESEIPLKFSDIGVETDIEELGNDHKIDHSNDGKFLMSLDYYSESSSIGYSSTGSAGTREIKYFIYRTDFQIIYNRLMKDAKTGSLRTFGVQYDFGLATTVEGLKANKAWYYEDEGYHYLFEYEGMIIKLDSSFAFSKEQLKTADTIFYSIIE